MTARPILFSGPMVRALLDGSKTQTRRIVKPRKDIIFGCVLMPREIAGEINVGDYSNCPYGQPGDRLWVRETFFAYGRWETSFSAKKGRDEWHFVDMTQECVRQYGYPATGPRGVAHKRDSGITPTWWKRPAIFMPRWASRITLEITRVRVEKLQSCNEIDAIAEGAQWAACGSPQEGSHRAGYAQLWESINGPGSWAANPWVWVVEFRRVES